GAEVDDYAGTVDVGQAQVQQLTQPQSAGISGLQQHTVPARWRRLEQPHDLGGTEHARQRLGPLPVRNQRQLFRPAERHAVEETQATDRLIKLAPGDAAFEQMKLEGTDFLRTEQIGHPPEETTQTSEHADRKLTRS